MTLPPNGVLRKEKAVISGKAMRPRVYTRVDAQLDPSTKPDSFLQKLVKYIPAEIVAAYVAVADALKPSTQELVKATQNNQPVDYTVLWVVFWILLILTLPYTWFFTQEPGKPKPVFQTIVAPIAFFAWVFVLGGPFTPFKEALNQPAIGPAVLVIVLLVIPLAEKIFVRPPT